MSFKQRETSSGQNSQVEEAKCLENTVEDSGLELGGVRIHWGTGREEGKRGSGLNQVTSDLEQRCSYV